MMRIFGKLYSKLDQTIFTHLSRSQMHELQLNHDLLIFYAKGVSTSVSYDFTEFKKRTLDYVSSNKVGNHIAEYRLFGFQVSQIIGRKIFISL